MLKLRLLICAILIAACTPVDSHEQRAFTENIGRAKTASVILAINSETASLNALPEESFQLIEADLDYFGEIEYKVSGSTNKIITIREDIGNRTYVGDTTLFWTIDLTRTIPLDLSLEIDAGNVTANLVDLKLQGLDLNIDDGRADVRLPAYEEEIDMNVFLDSGSLNLAIPNDVRLDIQSITLDDGSALINVGENVSFVADVNLRQGEIAFEVQGRSGVQVNIIEVGEGTVSLPSDYQRMIEAEVNTETESDDTADNETVSQETLAGEVKDIDIGVWESPDFADSEATLVINVRMRNGKVIIR